MRNEEKGYVFLSEHKLNNYKILSFGPLVPQRSGSLFSKKLCGPENFAEIPAPLVTSRPAGEDSGVQWSGCHPSAPGPQGVVSGHCH